MLNTTLCYITRGDEVLMLHRVKKENDINKDKWIGIGGKFEGNESPDECLLREAWEETGLKLTSWKCRGVVTFLTETGFGEFMYLFTADGFEGELKECDEGELRWVSREFLDELNELAARVWQRVARGEAYDIKPASRPGPKPKSSSNTLLPMLLLLVLAKGRGKN